uniref:Retrotransposon protein, putative, Ty1-copia subclass n=1 Tax=Tanacetum cinerariifolium TaxID=118510 RepID=A0A6L2P214_TANCI|nr:hypothetical protein [Tanacetum cinerariifolium]
MYIIEQPIPPASAADSVANDLSVGLILNGLTSDFAGFVRNYNMHNMGKTIGELHALLINNGIYKIDMSILVPNVNSIYNVSNKRVKHNLDFTYLWHYRLAHISKKCIEQLQHDGLLKSTDNESFNQCVSCLSGKMTRKSFPYRSKRATDLLGLIHTDVCGPLRHVPRKYASYFITFMDDYSRYGYIYLLKQKHEVFETLKVFKNEVENPLGKTIKALRSARGGHPKETMGYYFYFPPKNKIVVARYAEFFEKNLLSQEVSGRAGELEKVQDEDTSLSEITSKIPMEEHSLGDLNEPANYNSAMLDTKSNKWLDAINAEMQSMKDNQVWRLVDLPLDYKTVGSKWLFKKKTDMDGIVHTYKARLMAKGFTQFYGVDYEETLSPVVDIRSIRILIAIATFNYEIWQMDVETAFLNGYLDEDIYMVQPEVDWKRSKQSTTTMSATEAEYIAAMKVVWIRKFISGLDDNLADPFTKALSKGKLTQHSRSMGLRLASSFM